MALLLRGILVGDIPPSMEWNMTLSVCSIPRYQEQAQQRGMAKMAPTLAVRQAQVTLLLLRQLQMELESDRCLMELKRDLINHGCMALQ